MSKQDFYNPSIGDYIILSEGMHRYWPLEVLGIQPQPHLAYTKLVNTDFKIIVNLETTAYFPASSQYVDSFKVHYKEEPIKNNSKFVNSTDCILNTNF